MNPTDFSELVRHWCGSPLSDRQRQADKLRGYAVAFAATLDPPFDRHLAQQLREFADLIEAGRQ